MADLRYGGPESHNHKHHIKNDTGMAHMSSISHSLMSLPR